MKYSLILYTHGLGDVIILTPVLRQLYENGFKTHLMCRKEVITSHLLDSCQYIEHLTPLMNPWTSSKGFQYQERENIYMFDSIKSKYDFSGMCLHHDIQGSKLRHNFKELNLSPDLKSYNLEVFIDPTIEEFMRSNVIETLYPNGYIFNHTAIEYHPGHTWDSTEWIKTNIPKALPIVDTGFNGNTYRKFENINSSFVLLKYATNRVLSSSVFVHAADALDLTIDIINYGTPDRKVWPENQKIVKHIRENGKIIK